MIWELVSDLRFTFLGLPSHYGFDPEPKTLNPHTKKTSVRTQVCDVHVTVCRVALN